MSLQDWGCEGAGTHPFPFVLFFFFWVCSISDLTNPTMASTNIPPIMMDHLYSMDNGLKR